MTDQPKPVARMLVSFAALIIIAAGIHSASSIFAPLLLALFVTVLCLPLLNWLNAKGIPTSLSILLILTSLVLLVLVVTGLVGQSLALFQARLPSYVENLRGIETDVFGLVQEKLGVDIHDEFEKANSLGKIMGFVGSTLSQLSSLLSNGFLVLLAVAFMLGEAAGFPAKLAATSADGQNAGARLQSIADSINRYMVLKTAVSLGTGTAVWLLLRIVGVDFPVLWAALAFLLNFVPNIGSILAAIPPVLLALVQKDMGFAPAGIVAVGFVVINVLFGSVIEPRLMGKQLGVSTLVVFASLIIWGWLLGPVGMLLSVPLTITLKIGLESFDETRPIAIWLSDGPPEDASASTDEAAPTA